MPHYAQSILLSLLLAFSVQASEPHYEVKNAFARASMPGMPMSAAFMTIHNNDSKERFLVSATSTIAEHVELHGHVKVNGMMRMRQMAHIHLPAGQDKTLQPGGLHIMFIGLEQPLKEGTTFPLTLVFDEEKEMTIEVPVRSISAGH